MLRTMALYFIGDRLNLWVFIESNDRPVIVLRANSWWRLVKLLLLILHGIIVVLRVRHDTFVVLGDTLFHFSHHADWFTHYSFIQQHFLNSALVIVCSTDRELELIQILDLVIIFLQDNNLAVMNHNFRTRRTASAFPGSRSLLWRSGTLLSLNRSFLTPFRACLTLMRPCFETFLGYLWVVLAFLRTRPGLHFLLGTVHVNQRIFNLILSHRH